MATQLLTMLRNFHANIKSCAKKHHLLELLSRERRLLPKFKKSKFQLTLIITQRNLYWKLETRWLSSLRNAEENKQGISILKCNPCNVNKDHPIYPTHMDLIMQVEWWWLSPVIENQIEVKCYARVQENHMDLLDNHMDLLENHILAVLEWNEHHKEKLVVLVAVLLVV